jgi:hypothetical protein
MLTLMTMPSVLEVPKIAIIMNMSLILELMPLIMNTMTMMLRITKDECR